MSVSRDCDGWAVTWRLQGTKNFAALPSEFEARSFAQICKLLVDCSEVHVLPPIGPIDRLPWLEHVPV